jgi:gamma-glutamyltranspeptidase / glutathione hydrolase
LGDIMTRKRYADTLDEIAENGADAFYTGRIANATIDIIQKNNGTMTLEDLRNYRAVERKSLNITYRGFRVYSTGAPSSGAVALAMLKTMETYDDMEHENSNLTMHRFDEAMRFAYGNHQQLADPDFIPDVQRVEKRMISETGAAEVRARILDNATQPVSHYLAEPFYVPSSHGTSHVVVVDGDGMAVSSTTTVNLIFGNQMMVPQTGVILNNEQNDFSIPGAKNEFGYSPSPANFIRPRKRSLSSITPVIVEHPNGTLYLVAGAAGGSRIISATTQVVWRILEQGMSMTQSLAAARIHDQLMPNVAVIEKGFDEACAESMAEKGHNVTWIDKAPSSAQGIKVCGDGAFEAVGEPRQKNSAGLVL